MENPTSLTNLRYYNDLDLSSLLCLRLVCLVNVMLVLQLSTKVVEYSTHCFET